MGVAIGPGDRVSVKDQGGVWTGKVLGAWPTAVRVLPDGDPLGREARRVPMENVTKLDDDDAMLSKAKSFLKDEGKRAG